MKTKLGILLTCSIALMMTSCLNKNQDHIQDDEAIAQATLTGQNDNGESLRNSDDLLEENENLTYYDVSQVDQAPFFGKYCQNIADVNECNERNILQFIQNNIELPSKDGTQSFSGLEQVQVIVNTDGTVANLRYLPSAENTTCTWCKAASLKVVSSMTEWKPGMKDGKAVATQVTIPIRFTI